MSKTGTIRTFICIELPEKFQELLATFQESLKRLGQNVSWVRPSNIHLTLKFLGDVPEEKLPVICDTVKNAADVVPALTIQVKGAGSFPTARNPRVLWVGISPIPSQLRELQKLIDVGLSEKGFVRNDRPFSPHLTIGRVKSLRNVQDFMRRIQELEFCSEAINVNTVTVMKSALKSTGAHYTQIKVFPLLGDANQN